MKKTESKEDLFNAIWEAIKGWDIQREPGAGYAGATGTDVMTIIAAIEHLPNKWPYNATKWKMENCICTEWDGKGLSVCGVPCAVHSQ